MYFSCFVGLEYLFDKKIRLKNCISFTFYKSFKIKVLFAVTYFRSGFNKKFGIIDEISFETGAKIGISVAKIIVKYIYSML